MSKKRKSSNRTTRQERREQRRKGRDVRRAEDTTMEDIGRFKVKPRHEPVVPLTEAQATYDDAFAKSKIIFGIGPAGTGKTWFAAMRAAEALSRGEIDRIIITRPIVEAEDEGLGYLPGDLMEKYEPYLRPVKEAFEEFFGTGHLDYLLRKGIIEPRPLAFMRGSTLKNCWVIADEMQNATVGQFKLLLTRFGENAKFVINGDPTQLDIPRHISGLMDAVGRTRSVDDIEAVTFARTDVVRSGIVQDIIEVYGS